jgi:hypothetical protein
MKNVSLLIVALLLLCFAQPVAGAVGAATGGAAFAAAGGIGGFAAGSVGGMTGYAFAAPIQSVGNTAYFGDPPMTPAQFAQGMAISGLMGGSINGFTALANGRSFWNGKLPAAAPAPAVTTTVNPASAKQLQQASQENIKPYNASYQDASEIKLPEKLYKYTYEHPSTWKESNVILPGKDGNAYYTTDGSLNSLNAKMNLSLRKQPSFRIEILTTDPNFNFDNIEIIRTVNGNVFNSGGGAWEILYNAPYSPSHYYEWTITDVPQIP